MYTFRGNIRSSSEYNTIEVVCDIAGANGWDILHSDLCTMFLDGKLQQIAHMFQPVGYKVPGFERLLS